MKQYQYKVKTREGQQIQGIVEADDKNAAIGKLRSQKYYVTSLREKKAQKSSFSFLQPRGKVKAKHLAILCRQFAIQLETGLSLVNSLQLLEEQSSDPRVKQAFQQIRLDVASGSSFTKSLDKHSELFPHVFLRLIEAGEIAGALPAVLDRLAIYYEREDELRKKISEALMYPAVISVFAVVMVAAPL